MHHLRRQERSQADRVGVEEKKGHCNDVGEKDFSLMHNCPIVAQSKEKTFAQQRRSRCLTGETQITKHFAHWTKKKIELQQPDFPPLGILIGCGEQFL